MPAMNKVSVNILTKNRAGLLKKALESVFSQSFQDYEVVVVNDGSTDSTETVSENLKIERLKIINHKASQGITVSRQEALGISAGEYVAILDDDDEWMDVEKLKKQVEYLDEHKDCVLVGGSIEIFNFQFSIFNKNQNLKPKNIKHRPESDGAIRRAMLFRNNFFTSTVMFRREAAVMAGGFIKDQDDLAEDYDLWLRMGILGKMHNFQEVFAAYSQPNYNKPKFRAFLAKQLRLIYQHKSNYPYYKIAAMLLKFRMLAK